MAKALDSGSTIPLAKPDAPNPGAANARADQLAAAPVVIQTQSLTKVYRDFWGRSKVQALKALDLEIRQGEIFGLLGPNGSGKTTTMKLLLGLLFPSSGDAKVFGKPATD
ncbi:MAG TPA: ATP-binding cassette domain-containing protein, partial [Pirellulales bacterium]